jgi:hypothetical protein
MDAHQNQNGTGPVEPVQPEPQYVIQALHEENKLLYDNKLYLLSIIKQMQAEFRDAQAMWELERESLLKRTE